MVAGRVREHEVVRADEPLAAAERVERERRLVDQRHAPHLADSSVSRAPVGEAAANVDQRVPAPRARLRDKPLMPFGYLPVELLASMQRPTRGLCG